MDAKIRFIKETEISKEKTILDVANDLKLKIKSSCDGEGKCGKCLVKVVSGSVSEISKTEKKLVSEKKLAGGFRLACETRIQGDAEIILSE